MDLPQNIEVPHQSGNPTPGYIPKGKGKQFVKDTTSFHSLL
jgi:hypothetical protein